MLCYLIKEPTEVGKAFHLVHKWDVTIDKNYNEKMVLFRYPQIVLYPNKTKNAKQIKKNYEHQTNK